MLEIRIAKPCGEAWSGMAGDARVRHCGACRKNVYDIARMTEAEVEVLIQRTEGRFCARVYRRADGRVLTADCPGRVARRRALRVRAGLTLVVALLNAGCMGSTGTPPDAPGRTSGAHVEKDRPVPPPHAGS